MRHTHSEERQYTSENRVAHRPGGRYVYWFEQPDAQVDSVRVTVQPVGDQMVQPTGVGRVRGLVIGRNRSSGGTPLEYREPRINFVFPFSVQEREHVSLEARHRVILGAPGGSRRRIILHGHNIVMIYRTKCPCAVLDTHFEKSYKAQY